MPTFRFSGSSLSGGRAFFMWFVSGAFISVCCLVAVCRWTVFLENLVRFEAGEETLATPIEKSVGY